MGGSKKGSQGFIDDLLDHYAKAKANNDTM